MTETQTWTIGRLLEWTTDYLGKHGSDTPRLDAEVLLAKACNSPRIQLYVTFQQEPTDAVKAEFRAMVKRRAEGTPVAYLVGHKEFYSLNFDVTSDVLIPRNETEHLVMEGLDRAKLLQSQDLSRTIRIADLCTGSGCVAITLAKHLPNARIIACDISPEALKVAKANAAKLEVEDRVEFVESDLMATGFSDTNFDIIVSNPPYVTKAEFEKLAKSVRDFEPKLALVAGEDGLSVIRRIVEQADQHLTPDGSLLIEISPMIAESLQQWVDAQSAWKLERFIKDLAGLTRIAAIRRK